MAQISQRTLDLRTNETKKVEKSAAGGDAIDNDPYQMSFLQRTAVKL